MAEWDNLIIRTPSGIYIPADAAEKLKPYAQPPGLYDSAMSLLATPIFVLPAGPAPRRPWWKRVFARLARALRIGRR